MAQSYGWVGKILWVDLSTGATHTLDTMEYGPGYLGGRGIAARLAWEFLPPGAGALDPENLLIVMTGPLTGTVAPFSGRTAVTGLSPQGWPHEWYSRGNVGGHWGPSLKYAGYDGVVVTGRADRPCYLWIEDGSVEIRDAGHLWGLGTFAAQESLISELGPGVRTLTIGPAGENLSRISIINTETESAVGQGGYGAVMGSKNLKAIVVRGSGAVRVPDPAGFLRRCEAIRREVQSGSRWSRSVALDPARVENHEQRWQACTQQCGMRCGGGCRYYARVRGPVTGKELSGQFHCVSNFFPGIADTFYDWDIGFEAGFEMRHISDDLGLNHWDLLLGVMPWLRSCRQTGIIDALDGIQLDFDDPHVWAELLRRMAYREGAGDALAEGGRRAPALLGFGEDLADELYAGWGSAGHWDGHGDRANRVVYPFWIVSALLWAVDTRDPYSSSHGYSTLTMHWSPFLNDEGLPWDTIKRAAERLYGSSDAVDPLKDYEAKTVPAVWHALRSVIKDSVPVNDNDFPVVLSFNHPDGLARADGMEGPDFEYHLFTAATGEDLGREGFTQAAERVVNLERAIQVRAFGRSRADDETTIPYFERPEHWVNPLLEGRRSLDREQFLPLLDEFYRMRGWDPTTGLPTSSKLDELGLSDVAQDLSRVGAKDA